MQQPILSYRRRFKLWEYTVSHGQLLLRSPMSDEHPTRVDVLFRGVKSLHLPTLMNELHVEEADERTAAEICSNMGEWKLYDAKVFLVRGADFHGHVVAYLAISAEDTEDSEAASSLIGPSLVEVWRENSS